MNNHNNNKIKIMWILCAISISALFIFTNWFTEPLWLNAILDKLLLAILCFSGVIFYYYFNHKQEKIKDADERNQLIKGKAAYIAFYSEAWFLLAVIFAEDLLKKLPNAFDILLFSSVLVLWLSFGFASYYYKKKF